MRKFFSKLWHYKEIWIPLMIVVAIAAIAIIIADTNSFNPISIWLKKQYGILPP